MEKQNVAATLINSGEADLQKALQQDQHIAKTHDHLLSSSNQPSDKAWKQQPLKRYKQIWPQLLLVKGWMHLPTILPKFYVGCNYSANNSS